MLRCPHCGGEITMLSGTQQGKPINEWPIDSLKLSTRVHNALFHLGIKTIGDINKHEYSHVPNFGKQSYLELRDTLAHLGVSLPPCSKWNRG